MVITKIEQAKKRESRANIFLDEQFWLGLDKNDLLSYGLFRGKEISEADKKEIEQTAGFNKMLEKAINYTIVRPRSEKEMKDYLQFKRGFSPEETERMLKKLAEKGYLDDRRFTEWYVKNRLDFGVHGENKIYAELMSKGINSSLGREVLKSLIAENPEGEESNLEKIRTYAKKIEAQIANSTKSKTASARDNRQKLIQKLLARGFKYSDVKKALQDE